MKYTINESQLDNLIFKYLNLKKYNKIEDDNSIVFSTSEDNKNSYIIYGKKSKHCFIDNGLVSEISTLFSLNDNDSRNIIGEWVENVLGMEVTDITSASWVIYR